MGYGGIKMDNIWRCEVCKKIVDNYVPEICCSGTMESQCGCMGLPINPCLCSIECAKKLFEPENQQSEKELSFEYYTYMEE